MFKCIQTSLHILYNKVPLDALNLKPSSSIFAICSLESFTDKGYFLLQCLRPEPLYC